MKAQNRKTPISLIGLGFFLLTSTLLYSQAPDGFNYQAILRDGDGKIRADAEVEMAFTVLQGSMEGTTAFEEFKTVTTNSFGLVNLEIGSTNPAEFGSIDWSAGPYFLKIEVDGIEMGISKFLSVPYALYANTVENNDDADADPGNEIQTLSISGSDISISNGNTITLPTGESDLDTDPTNELITDFALNGSNLSITDAGGTNTVDMSSLSGSLNEFSDGGEATGANRTLGNTDYTSLGFLTGNQTRLIIKSNGNVGIGIADPSEDLEVQGKIRSWNGEMILGGGSTAPSNFGRRGDYIFIGKNEEMTVHSSGSFQGRVGIGTSEPSEKLDVYGNVRIRGSELRLNGRLIKGWGDYIALGETVDEIMTIHTGGVYKGRVGIGITNPTARLDVRTSLNKGIYSSTSYKDGVGVTGISTGSNGRGLKGICDGEFGVGLWASASGASGVGVRGIALGTNGTGIYGHGTSRAAYFDGNVTIENGGITECGNITCKNIKARVIVAAEIGAPVKLFNPTWHDTSKKQENFTFFRIL